MTAPSFAPSSQAGLASFRESPTEYNARIERLRAEYLAREQVAIRAARGAGRAEQIDLQLDREAARLRPADAA